MVQGKAKCVKMLAYYYVGAVLMTCDISYVNGRQLNSNFKQILCDGQSLFLILYH